MKTAAILIGVLVGLRVVIIILAVLAILYLLMIICYKIRLRQEIQ